jgi:malic enzyme
LACDRLREVSVSVARAVILDAIENGLAEPLSAAQIEQHLSDGRWYPAYSPYEYVPVKE